MSLLLLSAFALRMLVAVELPNVDRPDEVFQGLEPAHRLSTGWGIVTWEWRVGIRSWLLPGMLAGVMRLGQLLDLGRGSLIPVAAVLSIISLGVVAAGFVLGWRHSRLTGGLMCGGLCAVWPDLVLFAPKALTEAQAGHLLVIAAALATVGGDPDCSPRRGIVLAIFTGMLLGFTFFLRIQLAPAVLLVALWVGRLQFRERWAPMLVGGMVPMVLSGIIDTIVWNAPFVSMWRNFHINLLQGRAAEFGTSPFYWYVAKLANLWGAGLVPVTALFLLGARHVPLMACTALVVGVSHNVIGHKELSFIYAGEVAAIVVAGIGTAEAVRILIRILPPGRALLVPFAAAGLWIMTSAAMMASTYLEPLTRSADGLRALDWLHARADLCGLGFGPGISWQKTGGYSHLDRAVPILLVMAQPALDRGVPGANYMLAVAGSAMPAGYVGQRCWDAVCVYKRPGGCDLVEGLEVNAVLARSGE